MYKNLVRHHIWKKNYELNAQQNQKSRHLPSVHMIFSTINNSVHIIHVIFGYVYVWFQYSRRL